jgi:hypothetical protein
VVTRVDKFLGGLGIDATDKFEVQANATVTVGDGESTGNVSVGGKVGIGTSTPEKPLHVKLADSGAAPTGVYAALIENSQDTGLQILAPDGYDVHLALGNQADPQHFRITMNGTDSHISSEGNITFGTASAGGNQFIQNRLRIDENGNVSVGLAYTDQEFEVNGTIKATAFSGDGSSLTGVNPTTHLAVGTYAMLMYYETSGTALSADGTTIAGSSLRYGVTPSSHSFIPSASDSVAFTQPAFFSISATGGDSAGASCSGTWRLMGMDVPGRTTFTRTDSSGETPVSTTYYAWFFGLFVRTA